MIERIAWLGVAAWPAVFSASCLGLIVLVMERSCRRAAPPLRVAILRVALLKFTLPGVGLALVPAWGAFVPGSAGDSASVSPWWAAVWAAWVGGALFMLLRTVRGTLALRRLVAASEPAEPPGANRLAALSLAIGARAPRLRVSTQVMAPFVCGSLRPTIVLPAAWSARVASGELDPVLLHELAHVKRGDLLWMELTALVAIAWWWHPLWHLVATQASAAQEDACDDLAVSTIRGNADDYSQALVAAASLAARTEVPAFAAGLGAERIERRLRRLADPQRRFGPRLARRHLLLVLALATAAALAPTRGNGARLPVDGRSVHEHAGAAHARTHPQRHRHFHGHP